MLVSSNLITLIWVPLKLVILWCWALCCTRFITCSSSARRSLARGLTLPQTQRQIRWGKALISGPLYYYYFLDSYVTIDGINTAVLTDSTLVQAARDHFGCQTMTYVRLENQGTSGNVGNHWERKIFGNEVKFQFTESNNLISDFQQIVHDRTNVK